MITQIKSSLTLDRQAGLAVIASANKPKGPKKNRRRAAASASAKQVSEKYRQAKKRKQHKAEMDEYWASERKRR